MLTYKHSRPAGKDNEGTFAGLPSPCVADSNVGKLLGASGLISLHMPCKHTKTLVMTRYQYVQYSVILMRLCPCVICMKRVWKMTLNSERHFYQKGQRSVPYGKSHCVKLTGQEPLRSISIRMLLALVHFHILCALVTLQVLLI